MIHIKPIFKTLSDSILKLQKKYVFKKKIWNDSKQNQQIKNTKANMKNT